MYKYNFQLIRNHVNMVCKLFDLIYLKKKMFLKHFNLTGERGSYVL